MYRGLVFAIVGSVQQYSSHQDSSVHAFVLVAMVIEKDSVKHMSTYITTLRQNVVISYHKTTLNSL